MRIRKWAMWIKEHLRRRGIRVLLGRALCQVSRDPDGNYAVTLAPDATLHAQALVMAGSRLARTDVLAELAGSSLQVTDQGIQVDQFCRAAEGIWAIGDVTGMVPLSHFARYQAQIAADDMLGQSHPARYTVRSTPLFHRAARRRDRSDPGTDDEERTGRQLGDG